VRACRALATQRRIRDFNQEWASAGLPQLRIRIGINTGRDVAGNMGTGGVRTVAGRELDWVLSIFALAAAAGDLDSARNELLPALPSAWPPTGSGAGAMRLRRSRRSRLCAALSRWVRRAPCTRDRAAFSAAFHASIAAVSTPRERTFSWSRGCGTMNGPAAR
jgi:hypothetical protein